jgi:hypothetical protein
VFGLKKKEDHQKKKPADAKLTSLYDYSSADLRSDAQVKQPKGETPKKGGAAKKATASLFDDDEEDGGDDFFANLASIPLFSFIFSFFFCPLFYHRSTVCYPSFY